MGGVDFTGTTATLCDLFRAADARTRRGLLYDLDGDGDATVALETSDRTMANDLFTAINEAGHI